MTVSKWLADWLKNYEGVGIDTNHIEDGSDQYGLFKAPTRTVSNYIDDTYTVTEWYSLYIRHDSVSEEDREDSDAWLEGLVYWIDDFSFLYEYPALGNGRTVQDVIVTGTPYPIATDSDDTLYQLSLSITYTRERSIL